MSKTTLKLETGAIIHRVHCWDHRSGAVLVTLCRIAGDGQPDYWAEGINESDVLAFADGKTVDTGEALRKAADFEIDDCGRTLTRK